MERFRKWKLKTSAQMYTLTVFVRVLRFAHGVQTQFLNFIAGHSVTRRRANKIKVLAKKAAASDFTNMQVTCNVLYSDFTYNLESANDLTKHWSFLTVKSSLQLGEITLERTKSSQAMRYVGTNSQHELH